MYNKILIGVFALVIATAFVYVNKAQSVEPVTDGLVSNWAFAGDAKDGWGNNHGTLKNGPQFVEGKFGTALKFDGKDDYVEVPDSDSLDITDAITVEAWVKPDEAAGYNASFRTIVAKDMHQEAPYLFIWDSMNGELEFVLNNNDTRLAAPYWYGDYVGTWVHVAATYDKTEIKIYADGELILSKAYSEILPVDDAPLRIGYDGDFEDAAGMTDRYFKGTIDDVRIYNRALTNDEIKHNLTAKGFAVTSPTDKLSITWGKIKS